MQFYSKAGNSYYGINIPERKGLQSVLTILLSVMSSSVLVVTFYVPTSDNGGNFDISSGAYFYRQDESFSVPVGFGGCSTDSIRDSVTSFFSFPPIFVTQNVNID